MFIVKQSSRFLTEHFVSDSIVRTATLHSVGRQQVDAGSIYILLRSDKYSKTSQTNKKIYIYSDNDDDNNNNTRLPSIPSWQRQTCHRNIAIAIETAGTPDDMAI